MNEQMKWRDEDEEESRQSFVNGFSFRHVILYRSV